jgi:hypothetical protein
VPKVLQVQLGQLAHKAPQVLVIYPDPKAQQEQQVLDTEDPQAIKVHKVLQVILEHKDRKET